MNSRQLFLSIVAAHNAGADQLMFENMHHIIQEQVETYFQLAQAPRLVSRSELPEIMQSQLDSHLLIEDPRPCGNIVAANVRPHEKPMQVDGILWMDFRQGRLSRLGFLSHESQLQKHM